LNTVFAQDISTLQLIKKYNKIVNPEAFKN